MMPVTTYQLKKKMAEVNRELMNIPVTSKTGTTSSGDTMGTGTTLNIQKIIKVDGSKMITENGTKAELFSPMPCLFWKCTTTPDSKGVATLRTPIQGLFITDGNTTYCLGITGASDEFEVRFHVGGSEVRLNNEWLNLVSKHIVQNGVEI